MEDLVVILMVVCGLIVFYGEKLVVFFVDMILI